MNNACANYNKKIQLDKCFKFGQDKDHEYKPSYLIELPVFISYWKINRKDIVNMSKLIKELVHYFFVKNSSNSYT